MVVGKVLISLLMTGVLLKGDIFVTVNLIVKCYTRTLKQEEC